MRICDVSGCGRIHKGHGLCHAHLRRKNGKCKGPVRRAPWSVPRIIYDEVACAVPGLTGPCHVFQGAKQSNGYGSICVQGKTMLVHRYVWELQNGPVPLGRELDHRCGVKACCNPAHLRAVTHVVNCTENTRRVPPTHCPEGHEYTEDNCFMDHGRRRCRICGRKKCLDRYYRLKAGR